MRDMLAALSRARGLRINAAGARMGDSSASREHQRRRQGRFGDLVRMRGKLSDAEDVGL